MLYRNFKCYNYNFTNCVGFSIEIQVNGTATTRTQFCIGEMLTFVCRPVTSIVIFAWDIPSVASRNDLAVSGGIPKRSVNNFNATRVSDTECTLMFVAPMNLNGSEIKCLNAGVAGGPLISSTILLLHGEIFVSKH